MSAWQFDIMTEAVFISLHFVVFLLSFYLLDKKISQPATLFAFIWFLITAAHLFFKLTVLEEMGTPAVETYLIFLTGNISFTCGSLIINQYYVPRFSAVISPPPAPQPIHANLRIFFTLFLLAALPLYIKKAFDIFIASQVEEFFMGIKYEISYGEANFGVFIYLLQLSYVVFGINLYTWNVEKSRKNLVLMICSLSCALVYAVFASGRLHFFMVLCIYLGVTFFSGKKIALKKIAMPALVFFLFFFLAGVIYKKGGDIDNSLSENIQSGTESLGLYIVIPLDGLDYDLARHVSENTDGERTFRFFIKLAKETGIAPNLKPKKLLQEFVLTPYPTNVYTFYSSYILDFGKLYAWVMLFMYGMLHTFLYNISLLKRRLNTILYYSFLLFPLMLTFFDDLYMSVFSFWLQLIAFTEIILFADRVLKGKIRFR
ncbi:MAG: O-antigen polymerase [Ferruginibacter sp.]